MFSLHFFFLFFFFNDTATTEIYTLSLHDALPISRWRPYRRGRSHCANRRRRERSEEHTSELQSRSDIVCRLLLEKKKHKHNHLPHQQKTKNTTQKIKKTYKT